jgi:hypothetical protein
MKHLMTRTNHAQYNDGDLVGGRCSHEGGLVGNQ